MVTPNSSRKCRITDSACDGTLIETPVRNVERPFVSIALSAAGSSSMSIPPSSVLRMNIRRAFSSAGWVDSAVVSLILRKSAGVMWRVSLSFLEPTPANASFIAGRYSGPR